MDSLPPKTIDAYDLWTAGRHDELLATSKERFLRWAANYGLFPRDRWMAKFLELGELKRQMWQCVGRSPFPWAPLVELRMPLGCTAVCTYCEKAKLRFAPHANTKSSLFETIKILKFPETIGLCAEWGDPCLHPDLIDAINERIASEWLVTRYTFLTNLSATPAVVSALPYTRTLLVHFTMADPSHAIGIMGYKSADMFDQVLENLKSICALSKRHPGVRVIVQFVADPSTIPFISAHYALFREFEGLHSCRYKAAWKFAGKLSDDPAASQQRTALAEMEGTVPYDWRI